LKIHTAAETELLIIIWLRKTSNTYKYFGDLCSISKPDKRSEAGSVLPPTRMTLFPHGTCISCKCFSVLKVVHMTMYYR
jgi:hypothetical protein